LKEKAMRPSIRDWQPAWAALLAVAGAAATSFAQTTVVPGAVPPSPPAAAPAVVAVPAAVAAPAVVAERAVVVEQAPTEVVVAGQIVRTKQLDLRGATGKVLVALVDTGGGQRQIVDFGPTVAFKQTPIYTGDQISVRGLKATLGKLDVVLATQANFGGEEVFIKRVVPTTTVAAVACQPDIP